MMRALVVDDERLARLALRSLLEERGDVEVVGEADSVPQARAKLRELHPDVVFLDVQMPGGSGFELFGPELTAKVIFCTAYEAYAVRAFEVNALDYLVKPVGPDQLERALMRLAVPASQPAPPDRALRADDLVALREGPALRFARVSELTWLQAADDYSEVHLIHGEPALVEVTLKRWEERLPAADFVRIHRSRLVNLQHVSQIQLDDGQWQVRVTGVETPLLVSRRMAGQLKERLELRGARP
jgi:two-component system, LytTR family, response regulator